MSQGDHRIRGLLFACATAALWGVLAIVLRYSLRIADVATIVCFRFLFAFAALAALRPAHLRTLVRPPPLGLLAALLLASNYYTYFKGIELTNASSAQVLIQVAPLMLAVIGVMFFRERLRTPQRVGFAVALIGFALFYRDQIAVASRTFDMGVGSIAVAATTWAAWAGFQKHLTQEGHAPQALNLLTYGVAGLLFVPLADFSRLAQADALGWTVLAFLGANTLLAYGALGEALKDAPANQVSIVITLNPLITLATMALLGALEVSWIAPEPVHALGYLGAAFMLSGVILVVRHRPAPRP